MSYPRDPVVEPIAIGSLRPTQMTVGMREVEDKREHVRALKPRKMGKYLGGHMIPVVWGPKERYYIVDHHHLTLALHKESFEHVLVTVIADLRQLARDPFWSVLAHHGWVYPYDANGRRHEFSELPKSVIGLKDDPFRSLAGALRREGGFAKDTTPFSEFLWADYLRQHIKAKAVSVDFKAALKEAVRLAKSSEAQYLPGWCGPSAGN
jgi:hypothetical protein